MKQRETSFCRIVDLVSDQSGKVASFLFFPGWILVLLGVILRYFFNKPVAWAGDYAKYLFAVYFVIGGAYCLLHKSHIRVDVFYNRLSTKARIIVETFVVFPLFFAFIFPFLWHGFSFALNSLKILEKSPPPTNIILFPVKFMVLLAGILFMFQGIADLYRSCFSSAEKEANTNGN